MNMETRKHNVVVADERWDHCEHLKVGERAKLVFCEDDSFGPVARMAYCEACAVEAEKAADEALDFCTDCGNEVPTKELTSWMGYDWSVSQGDEPLQICKCCIDKPKHVERAARNKRELDAEMQYEEDHYDY